MSGSGNEVRYGDRVLVTGGLGFIGSHVVEKLLKSGSNVFVLDDERSGSVENLASVRDHPRLCLLPPKSVQMACTEGLGRLPHVDTVVHCAASVKVTECEENPIEAYDNNLTTTALLLSAYPEAKFVFMSSIAV